MRGANQPRRMPGAMAYVNNLKTFVRVFELGSMSAAARDLRISAAVASSRIIELEKHLEVRLFNRTTRKLRPTQQGELFYTGAIKILDAIEEVEGSIAEITSNPKGTLFISAPLGIGKKVIGPLIPKFQDRFPQVSIRFRLSDRKVDVADEGLDAAFVLGRLADSELRVRPICDFERVLCAAPSYIAAHGKPSNGKELCEKKHHCLLLRFPGIGEFYWSLLVDGAPTRFDVDGPLECDDGDVLTAWGLAGHGIINKPIFEIGDYLNSGDLVVVAAQTPPTSLPFSCVYPHKRLQDPKARLFIEYMVAECKSKFG